MKLPLLIPSLLLGLALAASGDEIRRIDLNGAGPIPAPAQEDGKDGIARIKKVDPASLELFPSAKKPALGTILISPGGGYSILAVTHEGRNVAKMLNDAGWDAAVLLYHVSEGDKTRAMAIDDATKAAQLIRKRGAEFGLSTQRLGLLGFSAGGHLTARLAHELEVAHQPPDLVVLMYAAYLEKDGKILDDVAPGKAPVFLYVAADDKLSTSSKVYDAAAKEAGARSELHIPEGGGHGFGLYDGTPAVVRDWPEKLRAFLTSVTAKS